jgi:aryl-alcohol dehydrogenase-like predicted oxidoreductase
LVNKIGVSVYTAEQIDGILRRFEPGIVQLPLSILDQRLIHSGHLARLHRMGIEIHARSVFLQGVLLSAPADLPEFLAPLRGSLEAFHSLLRATGLSPLEGALAFIAQHSEVSAAIVGVTGRNELLQIAAAATAADSIRLAFQSFAEQDDALLNPARWGTAPEHAAGTIQ